MTRAWTAGLCLPLCFPCFITSLGLSFLRRSWVPTPALRALSTFLPLLLLAATCVRVSLAAPHLSRTSQLPSTAGASLLLMRAQPEGPAAHGCPCPAGSWDWRTTLRTALTGSTLPLDLLPTSHSNILRNPCRPCDGFP